MLWTIRFYASVDIAGHRDPGKTGDRLKDSPVKALT